MKKFLVTLLALMMLASSAFALELPEPGVLPLISEPVTLTLAIREDTLVTDYNDNYLTQYIEELTGVDLVIETLPSDSAEAKQKLSLMIAGGQKLPDIIVLGMTDAERFSYGSSGYFLPLNDWLENDAHYWNLAMDTWCTPEEKADVVKYATSPDGNIYGYPGYYIDPGDATALGLWVNKTWCDNLGIEVPKTTEEFYNMLKLFKEKDANGNGDPNDEIPYIGHNGWMGDATTYILNSFIYYCWDGDFNYQLNVGEDGKLYAPFTTEEFREGIRYLTKLGSEGLLSPLSFSQTQNELRSILCAPNDTPSVVGAFTGHPSPLFGSDGLVDRVWEYVACPALIGPEGVNWSPYQGWFGSAMTYITSDCEYPELAFRVLDAVGKQEASLTMRYGVQGVDWDYATEGQIRHHRLPGYSTIYATLPSNRSVWIDEGNIIWHTNCFNLLPPKLFAGNAGTPYEGNRLQQMDTLWYGSVPLRYDNHPDKLSLRLIFTAEETDMISEIEATLRSYVDEAVANFTLGNKNIETDWEAYLADLEGIGLDYYIEVAQTAYDRLNK